MVKTKEAIENFTFESREEYERAKSEAEFIQQIRDKADLSDAKIALKVYNKAVADKMFSTVAGYCFLAELRRLIVESGLVAADTLADIPVKEVRKREHDTMPARPLHGDRYQRLYEGQVLRNKKMKIALAAVIVMLAGFVIINFKFEYSIFTYFTNYKANMEEELIDKYENWEAELEEREQQLKQNERSES